MRNGWKPKDMTLRFTCPLLPDASASFALHFMPYTNTTTTTKTITISISITDTNGSGILADLPPPFPTKFAKIEELCGNLVDGVVEKENTTCEKTGGAL